jgi:hypothetical protein
MPKPICGNCGHDRMQMASMTIAQGSVHRMSVDPRFPLHHTEQTELAKKLAGTDSAWEAKFWIWMVLFPAGMFGNYFTDCLDKAGLLGATLILYVLCLLVLTSAVGAAIYGFIRWCLPRLYAMIRRHREYDKGRRGDLPHTWVCLACGHEAIDKGHRR